MFLTSAVVLGGDIDRFVATATWVGGGAQRAAFDHDASSAGCSCRNGGTARDACAAGSESRVRRLKSMLGRAVARRRRPASPHHSAEWELRANTRSPGLPRLVRQINPRTNRTF